VSHADPFAALRAADPARLLPPLDDAGRDVIVARALRAEQVRARRRRSRRLLLVPAALLLVVLLAGGAYAAYDRWVSPASPEYAQALAAAEADTPLPPGHTWALPPALTAGTAPDGFPQAVSLNGARLLVTLHAICHWEDAWADAIARHRAAGRARSAAVYDQLVARIPLHVDGASEDIPSMDAAGIQRFHEIGAAARRGDPSGLDNDLQINCPAGVRQPTAW
jgi:hypothetical protein